MLFDPNYPDGPFRFRGKKVIRSRPAKDWAKLLKSIVSDSAFKGLEQENSFLPGAPFHMSLVVHGRSSAIYEEKLIPALMKLYSKERWWIEEVSVLWDAVLHEVKRQHTEVDLEVYGRNLDDPERQKLDEVLEIYQRCRDKKGRVSDKDLQEIAKRADALGLAPEKLLGDVGRECLTFVKSLKKKEIVTVSDLVAQVIKPQTFPGSLQGFFKKFLSDALRDRNSRPLLR